MASKKAKTSQILDTLAKKYGKEPARNPGKDPMDHLVYGVLAGDGAMQKSRKAYAAVDEAFVDRNEMRVATREEIAEHLDELGNEETAKERADLLIRTLQGLFDAHDKVDVTLKEETEEDVMERDGLVRTLGSVNGLSLGLVAAVVARALPDTKVRLNTGMARVAQRVGLIPATGGESKKAAALAKDLKSEDQRVLAHYLLTEHSEEYCYPKGPDCDVCPCASVCEYAKKKAKKK